MQVTNIVVTMLRFSTHQILQSIFKVPRVVFLGLFSWLIIHWTLRLDSQITELYLQGLFYIFLLGIVGIVATALESNLVLVNPKRANNPHF